MWSIGIYRGESPTHLEPHPQARNPVVHPNDVKDLKCVSVADPFMQKNGETWNMFFEVVDGETYKGCIGLATSADALSWKYEQIVLNESTHLSYPYVFNDGDEFFMLPETVGGGGISLYKARNYPTEWAFEKILIPGVWADPSIFKYERKWWLFACSNPKDSNNLHLFYSDDLRGEWVEHPLSPLITEDNRRARPAGRVVVCESEVLRFCQDCEPKYGSKVRAFKITKLTPTEFEEKENEISPILAPSGSGWNSQRMHHLDPHLEWPSEWIACVDGNSQD